jgi:hypothetical protein
MYAWCQEMPGVSAQDFAQVVAELNGAEKSAVGLVAHVAGPTPTGFVVVDVWESKEVAERFHVDHLLPALDRAHGTDRQRVAQHFRIVEVTG